MLEANLSSLKTGQFGYFIEELSNTQFISYADLTSLVGVTQGTAINEGAGWLRFEMDGVELIVAKKNIRDSISWIDLSGNECIYGNTVVDINGSKYRLRLLKGADEDPTSVAHNTSYAEGTHNSEWSRLFYPIVNDDSNIVGLDISAPYRSVDLDMSANRCRSWCQETSSTSPGRKIYRGGYGPSSFYSYSGSSNESSYGWRPCLELIPPTLLKPNLIDGYVVNTSGQYLTSPEDISGFAFTKND